MNLCLNTASIFYKNHRLSRNWVSLALHSALLLILVSLPSLSLAQKNVLDTRITLQLTDVTVADVLSAIQDQAQVVFSYSNTNLNTGRKVSVNYDGISIQQALEKLLGERLSKVKVRGNVISLQGSGHIQGYIKTSDGQPAELVTVTVAGLNKTVVTNQEGAFHLRHVPSGTQTLSVQLMGYQPVQTTVELATDQTLNVPTIFLKEDSKTLREVVVSGNMNRFANKDSDHIARLPLKNLENPQVYSVISKELLGQQMVVDYQDAMKTAPGVVPFISAAGTNISYIRGFSVQARVRNGLATQAWTLVDPVNIERIEVIKGPTGTLFGASFASYGAVTNRVMKKPLDYFMGQLSYSAGSWDLSRLTVDVNTPLDDEKTKLLRVNAAVHNEKSFQNFGGNKSFTVAPSFSYKVSDRLTFLFDAELYKGSVIQQPYTALSKGVSFRNLSKMDAFYRNSFAGADIEGTKISNNIYLTAQYKISENWHSSTSASYSFNREADQFQITANWRNDTLVERTFWKNLRRDFSTINFQQNFNGNFNLGSMRNRLLVGFDLARNTDNRFVVEDPKYDFVNPTQPFLPFYKDKADGIVANSTIQYSNNNFATYGAYFSNVTNLTDRLLLMLSLRMDHYVRSKGAFNGVPGTNDFRQTALSPKLGVVYQVIKDQLSVFGNYLNGFNNLGPVTQPDGTVLQLDPQQANQWEAGVKTEAFDKKLSATLSFYDIAVSNSTRNDAEGRIFQDATQRSRGFDSEVIANPVAGLNIVAGYAYNTNKYEKANEAIQGKTVTSAPKHVFNTWISYKQMSGILRNVGIGAGANYVSDTFYDSDNLFTIPSYTVINSTVFYELSKWRLGVKVNNISNQHYYNAWGYPQAPRQIIGNVTLRF